MKHRNVSLFVPHLGCPHDCIFCNQKTISGKCGELTEDEIVSACETALKYPGVPEQSEVAFFGGSFTAIDEDLMIRYLETVSGYIGRGFGGIRISTRPDCINPHILKILKHYKVTSVELGAQSMDETVLSLNGRGHSPDDTVAACEMIKQAGFSLGLQMMTGLYGSDRQKDEYTASRFLALRPDTVRIYPTVVLENTRLAELYRAGRYTPASLDDSVELCAKLLYDFTRAGIRVIRLGLHSGGNVEEGFVAGVYHPAFGELCMSRIYRDETEKLLSGRPCGEYTVSVPAGEISKAVGQKRANLEYFASLGYRLKFRESEKMRLYTAALLSEENKCI